MEKDTILCMTCQFMPPVDESITADGCADNRELFVGLVTSQKSSEREPTGSGEGEPAGRFQDGLHFPYGMYIVIFPGPLCVATKRGPTAPTRDLLEFRWTPRCCLLQAMHAFNTTVVPRLPQGNENWQNNRCTVPCYCVIFIPTHHPSGTRRIMPHPD